MAERKVNNNNNPSNNNNRNNNNNKNNRNERNVNNKGDNKGDRKNGERLDDSKEQADLATAQAQLDKLKDKNKALTDSIFENGKKIEKCREEIGNIKKSKVNYREQKAEIFDMLRKYSDRMNLITSNLKAKKDQAMVLKREFPFPSKKDGVPKLVAKNLAYYDDQIRKIEEVLHMESLSSGEVKMKTSQLEKVKSKQNDIKQFNELWLEITAYQDHNNELFEQKKKYKEKLVAIEKEEESFASLIEAQNVKIKAFTEEIEKIKEQRKQNNVEITAASKVKDEKKAILNKKWEEWKAQQSILRKQRAEEANALRQQRELQNKEREEQKVKKQDAADAKKFLDETNRPYAVEIKACEFLLKYIKEIKINKQKLDAPIKKIPMDIVVKFETLSLNPPFVGKDIESISQTLNEKKKYFSELRDATLQQQKEKNKVEKPSEIVIEEAKVEAKVEEKAEEEKQNGEAKEEVKEEAKVEEKAEEKKEEAKVEEKAEEEKQNGEEAKEEQKGEVKEEEKQNGEEVKEEHKEEETVESN